MHNTYTSDIDVTPLQNILAAGLTNLFLQCTLFISLFSHGKYKVLTPVSGSNKNSQTTFFSPLSFMNQTATADTHLLGNVYQLSWIYSPSIQF